MYYIASLAVGAVKEGVAVHSIVAAAPAVPMLEPVCPPE